MTRNEYAEMTKPNMLSNGKIKCRKVLSIYILLFLGITLITLLVILSFGSVQWNKYVYIFQCYILRENGVMGLSPPSGYSGIWRQWHRNGQISFEGIYKEGKLHGPWSSWYRNGMPLSRGIARDGLASGWHTYFYENGCLHWEVYIINSKFDGSYTAWHENGVKEIDGTYVDNKKQGTWLIYNKNGVLCERQSYKQGRIINSEKTGAECGVVHKADQNELGSEAESKDENPTPENSER